MATKTLNLCEYMVCFWVVALFSIRLPGLFSLQSDLFLQQFGAKQHYDYNRRINSGTPTHSLPVSAEKVCLKIIYVTCYILKEQNDIFELSPQNQQ